MIEFLLASSLIVPPAPAIQSAEDVNKVCSYIVGIRYASDNFDDNQGNRFVLCKDLMRKS